MSTPRDPDALDPDPVAHDDDDVNDTPHAGRTKAETPAAANTLRKSANRITTPAASSDPAPFDGDPLPPHAPPSAAFDLSSLASFGSMIGSTITHSLMGDDLQIDLQRTQSTVRKIERVVKDSDIDKFFNDIVSDIYYQIVTSEQVCAASACFRQNEFDDREIG
jgi:hypothetical protein